MIINVHGGHSLKCRGASGLLDEVNEDRKVKNKVIELLRNEGHVVYDCTDDVGRDQNSNLRNIVKKCNAHTVNLDVSIHLNGGKGTGTEVYVINKDSAAKPHADRIANDIANALGIRNRGVKIKNLYVLRKVKAPALLVECCFVDNQNDKDHWNVDKCATAIVEGIIGVRTQETHAVQSSKGGSEIVKVGQLRSNYYADHNITVDGYFGPNTKNNIIRCFQKAINLDYGKKLTVDGIVGEKTLDALGNHYVKKGERQELVRAVQIALYCYGYDAKWTDGIFGDKTKECVQAFQRDHGLSADGVAGKNTIKKMIGC